MNAKGGDRQEIERQKPNAWELLRLKARMSQKRQVNDAEVAAGAALAAVERAAAELDRRCADSTEARLKLVEAESMVGRLEEGEKKSKLESSLRRARAAVEELGIVCRRIPKE